MSNKSTHVLRIDSIYPEHGEIMLSGRVYSLSERIQLHYYKVGMLVDCTISDNVVVFMKKSQNPPETGNPSTQQGFVSAYNMPRPQVRQTKNNTSSMIWCNSMTNAIEILKLEVKDLPMSDVAEIDLPTVALTYASKFYKAGMDLMAGDHV